MARDSLFGEEIIWVGRPVTGEPSRAVRASSLVLFIMAVISTSFAAVESRALNAEPTEMLLFAFWCAGLGLLTRQIPRFWLTRARYIITEHHVITILGPFRRSMERRAISFARIYWNPELPIAGDLEVIRAVPTGALRRRLVLRLTGVRAPDRVWAIIRGAENLAPLGHINRPLAQRLDSGERVIWSARPRHTLRSYIPGGRREWALLAIAGVLFVSVARMLKAMIPALGRILATGIETAPFAALVFGVSLAVALVLAVGCYLFYDALIRPGNLQKQTRYLITDKRVFIQRGAEELHLDRIKIVDAIDTPAGQGLSDVFLILDGPRARALAASGAFGEIARGPHLRPVFEAVDDAEGASQALRGGFSPPPPSPELHRAA